MLLKAGANVNAHGGHFDKALCAASSKGYDNIVQMLIDNGADVNQDGHCGGAAQRYFYYWNDWEGNRNFPPRQAATRNPQEADDNLTNRLAKRMVSFERKGDGIAYWYRPNLKGYMEKNPDLRAKEGIYSRALQAASGKGYDNIVRILVLNGADVNANSGLYGNALQGASRYGHVEVARILIDHGADVNAEGGHYETALQAACDSGHLELAKMLVKEGADVGKVSCQ